MSFKRLLIYLLITSFLLFSCSFSGSSQCVVIYGDSRTNHQTHQKIVNAVIKIKLDLVEVFNSDLKLIDSFKIAKKFSLIISGQR
ncbi:MAG TPA: hypothetical protein ENI31_00850 [Candidatus Omnitrophica bacterium]|nr:MAG: hypothetical protein DRP61_04175 [Candidatus Omnitrophota bacterium]RKY33899.1 MAG: hypothetical protein DRP69_05790 [Candidatus Omnitrophota bacterium]RKY42345.1 MAG: hypothetical protein DRP80_06935 [Candidatus Omnitrophota bacterium]HEC68825.1 hypothetical protein [Candidatus Omnitrophota bacterium]